MFMCGMEKAGGLAGRISLKENNKKAENNSLWLCVCVSHSLSLTLSLSLSLSLSSLSHTQETWASKCEGQRDS